MRWIVFVAFLLPLVSVTGIHAQTKTPPTGCTTCDVAGIDANATPKLLIRWKRAVMPTGETASPFANAEKELDAAHQTLQASLAPLGVEVVLQKAELSIEKFRQDPLASNRIWLNGTALEMYLPETKTGQVEDEHNTVFRTVSFGGGSIRDVPAQMIVYAGLIASANSVQQTMADIHAVQLAGGSGSCCAGSADGKSCCAPGSDGKNCQAPSGTTAKKKVKQNR